MASPGCARPAARSSSGRSPPGRADAASVRQRLGDADARHVVAIGWNGPRTSRARRAWGRTSRGGSARRRARQDARPWPSRTVGAPRRRGASPRQLTDSPRAVRLPSRRTSRRVTPSHRRDPTIVQHRPPLPVNGSSGTPRSSAGPRGSLPTRPCGLARSARGLRAVRPRMPTRGRPGHGRGHAGKILRSSSSSDSPAAISLCEPASGSAILRLIRAPLSRWSFAGEAAPRAASASSQETCREQRPRMSSDRRAPPGRPGRRPGSGRQIAVAVGNAGHVRQGVGQDFGAERAAQGVRVIAVVGLVCRRR